MSTMFKNKLAAIRDTTESCFVKCRLLADEVESTRYKLVFFGVVALASVTVICVSAIKLGDPDYIYATMLSCGIITLCCSLVGIITGSMWFCWGVFVAISLSICVCTSLNVHDIHKFNDSPSVPTYTLTKGQTIQLSMLDNSTVIANALNQSLLTCEEAYCMIYTDPLCYIQSSELLDYYVDGVRPGVGEIPICSTVPQRSTQRLVALLLISSIILIVLLCPAMMRLFEKYG